jgi:hypothetical protein
MKRISFKTITLLFIYSSSALAFSADSGTYLGLAAGIGTLKTPGQYAFNTTGASKSSNSKSQGGLSGRASIGFNFNHYIGLEAGFAKYARSLYQISLV